MKLPTLKVSCIAGLLFVAAFFFLAVGVITFTLLVWSISVLGFNDQEISKELKQLVALYVAGSTFMLIVISFTVHHVYKKMMQQLQKIPPENH